METIFLIISVCFLWGIIGVAYMICEFKSYNATKNSESKWWEYVLCAPIFVILYFINLFGRK